MPLTRANTTTDDSAPYSHPVELTSAERELLRQLQEGGSTALASYFAELRGDLRQMLRYRIDQRLKRRLDSSDIIQNAYLESCRRLPVYLLDPQIPPSAWVRRLVRQTLSETVREHVGTQCRDVRRESHVDEPTTSVSIAELSAALTPPESRLQESEMRASLIAVLAEMPELDREILTLVHFESRTHREAAAELNITYEAAKKRYRRAILRLKEFIGSQSKFG